ALTILLLAGTGEAQSGLSISVHATGFTTPVAVVQDPTNRAVQFVVEQGGRIGVAQSGARLPTDFLNLAGSVSSGGERGLLGMGDGGSANDPENRAQTPGTLLGKMLRIDVNVPDDPNPASPTTAGYNVPANNPFVSSGPAGTLPEIWSFGLRNPWRFSFDDPSRGGTGALVIGDVGQGSYEEVDYEPAGRGGRNYGWRNREGAHDNVTSSPPVFLPLTEPIHEYNHSVGQSITGGFVYRGRSLPATFQGRYFFADFIRGRVWSMGLTIDCAGEAHAANVTEHTGELGGSTQLGNVSSF